MILAYYVAVATVTIVIQAYNTAMYSMARLNQNAARLMHKYG